MRIMEKFIRKSKKLNDEQAVTIAFLGDSVTQGCFEVYVDNNQQVEPVFDKNNAYHNQLSKLLSVLYPSVPVNIINAGISGGSALGGLKRIGRDVLRYSPDLTVVCFGLNDCMSGKDGVDVYAEALSDIFDKLAEAGSEVIFMTPNMMNTKVSPHIMDDRIRNIALNTMEKQNDGILDLYVKKAKDVCKKHNVPICDCYKKWKLMSDNGVDVTELLSNKMNHPTREMNWLFAIYLLETMLSSNI